MFPEELAEVAGLDPDAARRRAASGSTTAPGACATATTGRTCCRCSRRPYARRGDDPALRPQTRRMLRLAAAMDALPSEYFQYYYFEDEVLRELTAKPTTRAEDILGWVPGYWEHYVEQAAQRHARSSTRAARAAASTSSSWRSTAWTPSSTTAARRCRSTCPTRARCPGSPTRWWSRRSAAATPTACTRCRCRGCRPTCAGSSRRSGEYQQAAADAAWSGDARDAVRALAAHPLVRSIDLAEQLYGEMAAAHRAHLPARLLPA